MKFRQDTDAKIRILLVEDDEDDHVITRDVVGDISTGIYGLDWVGSFEAGLAVLAENRHDVCLLDFNLGERNGLDMLKCAATVGFTGPIIMLTGQADHALDMKTMAAGAADFLVKGSFDGPLLERSIRYAMDRSRYEHRIRETLAQLEEQNGKLLEANQLLDHLATIDGLTGVINHRAFHERLAVEFERARRHGHELSLLLLDVDNFKSFNDVFGHPAGDDVLRQAAQILKSAARDGDIVCRYGGEEFVVILGNTDAEGGRVTAERMRQSLKAEVWPHRPITASFGISTLNHDIEKCGDLISQADRAMYRSKSLGRDRVTHISDLDVSELTSAA